MMHFRSQNIENVDFHLQTKWEECISSATPLPATEIRTYNPNGDLSQLIQLTLPDREAEGTLLYISRTVSR